MAASFSIRYVPMYFLTLPSLMRTCHLLPFLRTPMNCDLLLDTPLCSPLELLSLRTNSTFLLEDINLRSFKRFASMSGRLLRFARSCTDSSLTSPWLTESDYLLGCLFNGKSRFQQSLLHQSLTVSIWSKSELHLQIRVSSRSKQVSAVVKELCLQVAEAG